MKSRLSLGVALQAMALGLAWVASAANAHAQQFAENEAQDYVVVRAKPDQGVDRLAQPIEDQPQTVRVIDETMLRQQAVATLDQAVRNIPGITANTGEGGGAVAGDQFRIRGFDAANDISTDGLRDFGVYTRDAFNIESVEVFLGPSGATFGRGSFGGAINTSSKFARSEDFTTVQVSGGSADLARATLDINRDLSPTTAVRLNLMGHTSGMADIDEASSSRWGAAASVSFGIGEKGSLRALYFHQSDNRVPYYGVPVATPTGEIGAPIKTDRSNFYGTEWDHDDTSADVVTLRYSYAFGENLSLFNDTRIGVFSRDFQATAPTCNATCANAVAAGLPATVNRGGQSGPYLLDQWGAQNITTLVGDGAIGGLKQQWTAGLDLTYETAERDNYNAYNGGTFPRPTADAYNPSPEWPGAVFVLVTGRDTDSTNVGLFASEQVWFTDALSLLAGLRVDRYSIESDSLTYGAVNSTTGVFTPTTPATIAPAKVEDDLFSPRISLIWQPNETDIYYISFARSAQPATGAASAGAGTPVTATLTDLEPTTSETFEIGARKGVFSDRLILGASLFNTERDNAKQTDPTTGGVLSSGDEQRVSGLELSAVGQITEQWAVNFTYTYLDTETLESTSACSTTVGAALPCPTGVANGTTISDPNEIGNPIPFASENAATLWTTYAPNERLTFGLGARYNDEVWLDQANTARVPYYFSVDGLVSYAFANGVTLQLNGANLLDRDDNFDQVTSSRVAHAAGRTLIASVSKTF